MNILKLTKKALRRSSKRSISDISKGRVLNSTNSLYIPKEKYINDLEYLKLRENSKELRDYIKDIIKREGPISFTRYMELALTHNPNGYYMKRDVFNTKGDFITSPEISQMFGECIGVWATVFFQTLGYWDLANLSNKKKVSFLEFGPGKGTLMRDVIRALGQFGLLDNIEINFIEVSPYLRGVQQETIIKVLRDNGIYVEIIENNNEEEKALKLGSSVTLKSEESSNKNIKITWFETYEGYVAENFQSLAIESLQKNNQNVPVLIICHEFFDAMPATIFEYSDLGWIEKLVDKSPEMIKDKDFQLVNSDPNSKNVKKILNPFKAFSEEARKEIEIGDRIEVQPKSSILMNSFSELISKVDGGILVVDYGENHAFSDSIRGICHHKYIEDFSQLLEIPGEADISAYVNFLALAEVSEEVEGVEAFPLINQGDFLQYMGIEQRLEVLKQSDGVDAREMESRVKRLVDYEEMGQVYKFMYVGNKKNGDIFPFVSEFSGGYSYE